MIFLKDWNWRINQRVFLLKVLKKGLRRRRKIKPKPAQVSRKYRFMVKVWSYPNNNFPSIYLAHTHGLSISSKWDFMTFLGRFWNKIALYVFWRPTTKRSYLWKKSPSTRKSVFLRGNTTKSKRRILS